MDAAPLLAEVARHMRDARLEAVLIGNAAAALQGAPVTTVEFDFLFRNTPTNRRKLKEGHRERLQVRRHPRGRTPGQVTFVLSRRFREPAEKF